MTPDQAIAEASKGSLRPVYLLAGAEAFLRDRVVSELRKAALGSGVAAFNEDKFTAGETDVDRVLAAARTVPMMANARFVLLRQLERWDSGSDGTGAAAKEGGPQASPYDKLAAYAAEPVPSTCLVLTTQKLDGRRKLSNQAKKDGFLVECEPLGDAALSRFIQTTCKAKGHHIESAACDLLAQFVGPELAAVDDALERLSLYVGEGVDILDKDIREIIVRVRVEDTWALVDAILNKNLSECLRILADVYDPRDRGLPLVGAIAWSVRQLLRFQLATARGARADEAARQAGIFQPSRARDAQERSRKLPAAELERWLRILAETDLALKSSRRPPEATLEAMLVRMARR